VLIRIIVGLITALVASWLLLMLALLITRPRGESVRHVARFLPDVVRLLRDLHRDSAVPRSVRWRLWVALVYNLQPFTIIPDFIPVIGFADNFVVTVWALRSAVRKAGRDAVIRNWHGSREQLVLFFRVARLGTLPEEDHDTVG
jgi:uncharacterized membrane protein YkvA (DUF1232 family)